MTRKTERSLLTLVTAIGLYGLYGGLAGCTAPRTPPPREGANLKTAIIPVEGMSCIACVVEIRSTLESIDGVAEVEVSLEKRNARVTFNPSRISVEGLASAIDSLGYRAGPPAEAPR